MFLRTTRVKRPDGRVDEYIRLVESYWNQGRPRHRIVCNLGRKDVLPPHAEALLGLLQGQPPRGAALGAGRGGLGLGAFAGGAVLVEGVGPGGHPGPHRSRSPAVGSDLGPGGQSPDSADQRARLGALVGNGLCLRSARPTRAPPVAGRSRTAGQPSAAPYLDPPGSRGLGIFPSPRERSREGSFPPPPPPPDFTCGSAPWLSLLDSPWAPQAQPLTPSIPILRCHRFWPALQVQIASAREPLVVNLRQHG